MKIGLLRENEMPQDQVGGHGQIVTLRSTAVPSYFRTCDGYLCTPVPQSSF